MVDTWQMDRKTTVGEIRQKAQEIVLALKAGAKDVDLGAEIYVVASKDLLPIVRNVFMYEVGKPFGGVYAFAEADQNALIRLADLDDEIFQVDRPEDLAQITWQRLYEAWRPYSGSIVIPISQPQVASGELATYSWQAFQQSSKAKGTEDYVDVYVTTEIGTKIPIPYTIFTFDAKLGTKVGQKSYVKVDTSDATRIGTQISRSFTIQTLKRRYVVMAWNPVYYYDLSGMEQIGY